MPRFDENPDGASIGDAPYRLWADADGRSSR
jgi:hypothetical protein